MHFSLSLALLVGAAAAMPTAPTLRFPTPEELSKRDAAELARRQVEGAPEGGNVNMCIANDCSNCQAYFGLGTGYPECPAYNTDQFRDSGFSVTETGQMQVYMDFPDPGQDCKYIIRTPVVAGDGTCGAPALVVQGGPQCAVLTLQSTFLGQFCCGLGDCEGAGTPVKRDDLVALGGAGSGGSFIFHDNNGTAVEPANVFSRNTGESLSKRSLMLGADEFSNLEKRCGDGDFIVTRGAYNQAGQTTPVSGTVTCSPTESCMATMGQTVTQEYSFSISVTVGDPLGIISATAGFEYSESKSREFSGTFAFGPGETGYVAFTPILRCVDGYFSGDCDNNGEIFSACTATDNASGIMNGDLRGVIVRS